MKIKKITLVSSLILILIVLNYFKLTKYDKQL